MFGTLFITREFRFKAIQESVRWVHMLTKTFLINTRRPKGTHYVSGAPLFY